MCVHMRCTMMRDKSNRVHILVFGILATIKLYFRMYNALEIKLETTIVYTHYNTVVHMTIYSIII